MSANTLCCSLCNQSFDEEQATAWESAQICPICHEKLTRRISSFSSVSTDPQTLPTSETTTSDSPDPKPPSTSLGPTAAFLLFVVPLVVIVLVIQKASDSPQDSLATAEARVFDRLDDNTPIAFVPKAPHENPLDIPPSVPPDVDDSPPPIRPKPKRTAPPPPFSYPLQKLPHSADRSLSLPDEPLSNTAKTHLQKGIEAWNEGRNDKALIGYTNSINSEPSVMAHYNRALYHTSMRNYSAAIADYETCLRVPASLHRGDALNNLAFLLATCSNPRFRNGHKALTLAEESYKYGENIDKWNFVGTLAAAHASVGDFDNALKFQERSWVLAPAKDRSKCYKTLLQYRRHEPLRLSSR
jgi:Tfp pilus assembly protein PilF